MIKIHHKHNRNSTKKFENDGVLIVKSSVHETFIELRQDDLEDKLTVQHSKLLSSLLAWAKKIVLGWGMFTLL